MLGSPSRDQWGYHRGHPDRRNLDSFWTGPFFDGQSLGSFGFVMLLLADVAATMPPKQVSGSDTLFVFLFALGGIFGPIASWVSLYRWSNSPAGSPEPDQFEPCARYDRTLNAALPRCPYCGADRPTTP